MIFLLAQLQEQENVFGSIRKGFNGSNYDAVDLGIILLLASSVLGIFVLFLLRRRKENQEQLNDPKRLFDELVAGHGLIASQRELLIQLASLGSIRKPSALFVRIDLFDRAAKNPAFQAEGTRQQIELLRQIMFGESEA